MNSNSNSDKPICVYYSARLKKFFFLHVVVSAKGRPYYYFSTSEQGAIPLPDGYEVVVNAYNGVPFVRKKRHERFNV